MAITATAVVGTTGSSYRSWTVTALDADTTTTIAHGMVATPDYVAVAPQVQYASTAAPFWGISVDSTNITLYKTTSSGSGGLTAGTTVVAKVYAMLPHSIMK